MIKTELWTLEVHFNGRIQNSYEIGRTFSLENDDSSLAFCKNSHFYNGEFVTEKSGFTKELVIEILRIFGSSDNKLASLDTKNLWPEAKSYLSNLEYLLDFAVGDITPRREFFNSKQVEKSFQRFFSKWFEQDNFYKAAAVHVSPYDYIAVAVTYDDDEDEAK